MPLKLTVDKSTIVNYQDLQQAFQDDSSITSLELGSRFKVHNTIIFQASKRIHLTYKFNHWVPHELAQHNKVVRKQTLRNFCWYIVNNLSRKSRWSETCKSAGNVGRRSRTNRKVLLCIWWDCREIICKEHLKSGQTIDSVVYWEW